jgi:hypothetical protein
LQDKFSRVISAAAQNYSSLPLPLETTKRMRLAKAFFLSLFSAHLDEID